MKKLLASALIALGATSLLVSPAGAAVPKTQATGTLACGSKTARVWVSFHRLAADNPCPDRWLTIFLGTGGGEGGSAVSVAPRAHFHWRGDYTRSSDLEDVNWGFTPGPECGGQVVLRGSHGKPVPAPDC